MNRLQAPVDVQLVSEAEAEVCLHQGETLSGTNGGFFSMTGKPTLQVSWGNCLLIIIRGERERESQHPRL